MYRWLSYFCHSCHDEIYSQDAETRISETSTENNVLEWDPKILVVTSFSILKTYTELLIN
jgi:hypothetical protein